jgi:hypothetical protein
MANFKSESMKELLVETAASDGKCMSLNSAHFLGFISAKITCDCILVRGIIENCSRKKNGVHGGRLEIIPITKI